MVTWIFYLCMEKIGLVEVGLSELNFVFVLLDFLCWLISLVLEGLQPGDPLSSYLCLKWISWVLCLLVLCTGGDLLGLNMRIRGSLVSKNSLLLLADKKMCFYGANGVLLYASGMLLIFWSYFWIKNQLFWWRDYTCWSSIGHWGFGFLGARQVSFSLLI